MTSAGGGTSPLHEAATRAVRDVRNSTPYLVEMGRGRRPREAGEPTLLEMEMAAVLRVVHTQLAAEILALPECDYTRADKPGILLRGRNLGDVLAVVDTLTGHTNAH